jgi:hypothetical protein
MLMITDTIIKKRFFYSSQILVFSVDLALFGMREDNVSHCSKDSSLATSCFYPRVSMGKALPETCRRSFHEPLK